MLKTVNSIMISNDYLISELSKSGWTEHSLGYYRSSGKTKPKTGFIMMCRRRKIIDTIGAFSKKSQPATPATPNRTGVLESGSLHTMGLEANDMTPIACNSGTTLSSSIGNDVLITNHNNNNSDNPLCDLVSFGEYRSLMSIRSNDPCLLIGYEAIREEYSDGGKVLSWHFSVIDNSDLIEYAFIRTGDDCLYFRDALSYILDDYNYTPIKQSSIRKYQYCSEWRNGKPVIVATSDLSEAQKNAKYIYIEGDGFTQSLNQLDPNGFDIGCRIRTYDDYSSVTRIPVCLVCCCGFDDLTAFSYGKTSILKQLTHIDDGLITLRPISYTCRSIMKYNHIYNYYLSLSVTDSACHSPSDKNKLDDLYDVLRFKKVSNHKDMTLLLQTDPCMYLDHASMNSIVTLLYISSIYGINKSIPATLISATSRMIKDSMMKYFGCDSSDDFDLKYRGLKKIKHKRKIPNSSSYVVITDHVPVSNDAKSVQAFASEAYHGGYNSCIEIGYFPFDTYDLDLKNAYSTGMCTIPSVNWNNPVREEIVDRQLTLHDFQEKNSINPLLPMIAYVQFTFPEDTMFPCIPINIDGSLIYPLSSKGLNGVYVAGPLIWLALKLGATVYCDHGYILNTIPNAYPFRQSVKQLVADRNKAKRICGKGSLEDHILKIMANCIYGKISQGVIEKHSWVAYKNSIEALGCSAITNPVSAMMITSIVQVILIAAMSQLHDIGYSCYSVTTDGMITNCPYDIIKKLDLYGIADIISDARLFLTDGTNPDMWEIKHHQDDLINFSTRGNISLRCEEHDGYDGVCAHNSAHSNYVSDSYEDRLWLMTQVLSRTGPIPCTVKKRTSFKDLVKGKTFSVWQSVDNIRMDFDLKRKPRKNSIRADIVTIDGNEYEIAHFDTIPYKDFAEYQLYRDKKELMAVLRTESDWTKFWAKLTVINTKARPRDMEWSILTSCIAGYRAGKWDIPGLNDKTVAEKVSWINSHNNSNKSFKESDWKNAGKKQRQATALPEEVIKDKLDELIAAV